MNEFGYAKARDIASAKAAFKAADDGRYLAGGQTLIPVLKQRLAAPSDLIDLNAAAELKGIKATSGTLSIGAMSRHAEVAASAEVRRLIPALAELAGGIGDPHVRNRGTLGGSIANNDPAADYPAGVLGLGATIVTDRRTIAADDFFQGLFTTALAEGELVTRVEFPAPKRAGYAKMPHPASRFCLVAVFVSEGPAGVRVAVTGAGPGVFRVTAMERALGQSFTADAIKGIAVPAHDLIGDMHASADYRAHLIGVLARRAVAKAIG